MTRRDGVFSKQSLPNQASLTFNQLIMHLQAPFAISLISRLCIYKWSESLKTELKKQNYHRLVCQSKLDLFVKFNTNQEGFTKVGRG